MHSNLYETDFYAWTLEQSKLLKERDFNRLDVINLVEEIESLGKQQRQELENRLAILLGHLLKWDYQPDRRSKGWKATIREQRRAVQKLIRQNLLPHLRRKSNGSSGKFELPLRTRRFAMGRGDGCQIKSTGF